MGWSLRGPRVALLVLLAAVLVPLIKPYTAQPAARYAFTAALWDDRSRVLDDYLLGVDRLEIDGHVYSDKAPGQPYLAVPFYAAYRAVGGDPGRDVQITGDLGLWWVTLWSSVVPALFLAWMMWGRAARLSPRHATAAAGGLCFGTLLLPFGGELYAHVLCAALLFGAWSLVSPSAAVRRPVMAGLLGGIALAAEYPSALLLVPMCLALLFERELRALVRFGLGMLPGIAALLVYQRMAFGGAGTISYSQKDATFDGVPKLHNVVEIFFGSRGIAIFTPVVLVGLVGLAWLVAERGRHATDAAVGLGCFGAVLWLQASWVNPWGGEMPGPRYLIPALPFLVLGVARTRLSHRLVTDASIALSAAAMVFPTVASHLVPEGSYTVGAQLRYLSRGEAAESLFTVAMGSPGWFVHAALVILAGVHLARTLRSHRVADPSSSEV